MKKALSIVVGAAALFALYNIAASEENVNNNTPVPYITTTITDVHIETPKIEQPKIIDPPVSKSTIKNPEMKIVDDNKVTEPPLTVDKLAAKDPGISNIIGNSNGNSNNTIKGNSTVAVAITPPFTTPVAWAEEMPEFNGDLNAFLQKQLQYPDKARDANIDGKVNVQFVVNEDGSVSNAKIIRGIGAGCDEEAVRIINSMPKWRPGKQNGRAVKVYFTLPIRFVLQ
jgi:protein TonB